MALGLLAGLCCHSAAGRERR